MSFKGFAALCVFIGLLSACSPLKKIESSKVAALATYESKDYPRAFTQLSSVIKSYKQAGVDVPNDIYLKAAESAQKIKNLTAASELYKEALDDSLTVIGVKGYIENIQKTENTNDLTIALNKYADFLKEAGQEEYVTQKMFNNAIDEGNDNLIIEYFSQLKTVSEDQNMAYLGALERLGKKKEAVEFCNKLVKENPSYRKAKEWKAVYYYNLAEEGYKREMDKYNKNKTYTAYVYLKRDLKKVSANYRIAKEEFEDLRKVNVDEKKYIKYLKNIYLRLEMKREAAAMDKLLK